MSAEKPKKLKQQLENILNHINSEETHQKIQDFYDNAINSKKELISQRDIINQLGLKEIQYQKLLNSLSRNDLDAKTRDYINQIIDTINSFMNTTKLVNDKIILSGAPLRKTTMMYLSTKKQEAQRELITINVGIKGTDELTLKKLLLDEEGGE